MPIALRPYQELAIAASIASPMQRQLIVLSTGMGKTITGLALARAMKTRTLWLAHREELISQPAQALKLVWPEASSGIVKAESNQYMRDVVFASIQSAQQPRRLAQLADQGFGLVVVDEAHHALSPGYRALLDELGCMSAGGPRLLGLTATPERSDNGALSDVFEGIVFQVGITTAIAQGYLVAPTVIERAIKLDLDAITSARGDYGAKQLDLALLQAGIVGEIAAAYEEHCLARKALIFVVSVAQAEAVAANLRERGHAVAALSGETPSDERRRILRKLQSGELRCVVNCMVLTEGFDEPSVDAIVLARPTQSKPLMIQCVGRGLRLHPAKSDCLVIDMVGTSKRNTLVQAAVLFGIRPDPSERPKPIGIDPLYDPEQYWKMRLLTQIEGVGGAPRSKLRWVPAEGGAWLLDAGAFGTVRMLPNGEEWTVDAVGIRIGDRKRESLTDCPVTMDIAQAYAEDYVRRVNAVNKALADASWRGDAAAKTQLEFLRKAGVKVTEGISKGTAADLELQVKAKHATETATPAQLGYLRRMYRELPPGLTKREAQGLIVKARYRKTNAQ
jgi:superfamily II DNA or RNA helicase